VDVLLNPLQSESLVEETEVPGEVPVAGAEETEDADAVLDGDNDDAAGYKALGIQGRSSLVE